MTGAWAPDRALRLAVALLALALVVAACGGGGAGPVARTPVVVDTDMGPDDALALLYLVNRRDLDVRAVAVSGTGLVRCPAGAQRALELLAAAGRRDIPVACGRDDPLAGFNAFPPGWRDPADRFFGVPLPASSARPDARGAVALLRSAAASAREPVSVVALAPLTDVAELLRTDARVGAVYAMAGALDVPGNVGAGHEGAEYNLWVDPVAADVVLGSGVPVTLVPLDATNDVPVTVQFALALQRHHYANSAASVAWELMDVTRVHAGGNYFWDPLAAAALPAPRVAAFRTARLRATPDGRLVRDPSQRSVRVAVGADRVRFERELLATLTGDPRARVSTAPSGAAITCSPAGCRYDGPTRTPTGGEAAFDTVNDSDSAMTHTLGLLHEGRDATDLRRALRSGRAFRAPVWFSPVVTGTTPPHSRMTWLVNAQPGVYGLVVEGPTGTQALATIRAGA